MPRRRAKKLGPIDLSSGEWIFFDWVNRRVIRNVNFGVAKSTEESMPLQYRGAHLRRLDTGELLHKPLEYCHFPIWPKVLYRDELFGETVFASTRCEFAGEPQSS